MVKLMVDIHVAESTIMLNRMNDAQPNRNAIYIRSVLDSNQIDTARFTLSFDYYTSHPSLFSEIYDEVIEKLSEMNAREKTMSPVDSLVK